MAVLDTTSGEIVIRVVYDGPPEAGKTTSIRALAASLAQPAFSPEEDRRGRTLWFDWMEYVGGRFEGCQIRCQIVTVPGQPELAQRRHALLETADVVVFVGDSTPARWGLSLEYLLDLQRVLPASPSPIGVVFQANKRDAPDRTDLDEIRLRIGDTNWSVGIVESIAPDGTGIREAFVYAVRLALDRVRDLMTRGQLTHGRPELTSPEQLLAQLRGREPGAVATPPRLDSAAESVAASLLRQVLDEERAPRQVRAAGSAPQPPDASVPSGAIWPPVEGRAILHDVSQLEVVPRPLANGDWCAGLGAGWRIVSAQHAVFDTLDLGRHALVAWARLHAACQGVVSPRRCIVLAATGDGRWRLWQIVRAEQSLRDVAGRATVEPTPELVVYQLCRIAQLLLDVSERMATLPCDLPCSLDTIGQSEVAGVYIGLMPELAVAPPNARRAPGALLASELGPMLDLDLAPQRPALGRALERVPRRFGHAETIVTSLARMLA